MSVPSVSNEDGWFSEPLRECAEEEEAVRGGSRQIHRRRAGKF